VKSWRIKIDVTGKGSNLNKRPWPVLTHRDKTREQMPAKIFPHLKVKC
jgi:hypothetical protein